MLFRNISKNIVRQKVAFKPLSNVRFSHIISVHRNTEGNNPEIPFEFNQENLAKAAEILKKYPSQYKKAAIMPLLDLGQRQLGFTSISVMNYVAKFVDVPPMRVYEVATFYTMYQREPVGKYHIQVCTTTPCQLCNSDLVMTTVMDHLGIQPGETTFDGLFSLEEVECLGACVNAPMIQVNDDYYEDLDTKEKVISVLDGLKNGEKVVTGTTKRKDCEPFSGIKTLLGESLDVKTVTRDDL